MSKWTAQSYSDTMLKYLLCLSSAQSNSPLTRLWLGLIEYSIIAQRNSFLSGSSKSASFCACLQCRILSSNQQNCHLRCHSQQEYCHLRRVTYCHLCPSKHADGNPTIGATLGQRTNVRLPQHRANAGKF